MGMRFIIGVGKRGGISYRQQIQNLGKKCFHHANKIGIHSAGQYVPYQLVPGTSRTSNGNLLEFQQEPLEVPVGSSRGSKLKMRRFQLTALEVFDRTR